VKPAFRDLTEAYAMALEEYLDGAGEAALLRAYQLGRQAVTERLGVLEMAAVHQEALVGVLLRRLAPTENARVAGSASEFFAEALAAFEMTQRSFREANTILQDLNDELKGRVETVLREYEAARDELEEQKRLERMKNEFISIVSHEVRTPLTSIHGALDLALHGLGDDQAGGVKPLLEIAHRNSRRLVRLVNQMLDIQKIESGEVAFEIQALELGPLLGHAVDANQAYAAQREVRLVLEGEAPSVRVAADPDRLMQVLTNLLGNAAKFSPPGQTVELRASKRDDLVRVSVTDRGPGIPEEFRARLFQKFAQADPSGNQVREGTGLGLSISRAIVERLGGRIGFESEVGLGTTFYFDLPQWREAPFECESAGERRWQLGP
jgi:signal transduction histidine kinase